MHGCPHYSEHIKVGMHAVARQDNLHEVYRSSGNQVPPLELLLLGAYSMQTHTYTCVYQIRS